MPLFLFSKLALDFEQLRLKMREQALFRMGQILIFQVDLIPLLDDFPKFLVVLLPQVLVSLLLPQ